MEFLNGSGKAIDTIHPDTFAFFEMLAQLVDEEPAEIFTPLERFQMQAIGIEKGKPFKPDAKTRALLSEAARTGSGDRAGQQLSLRPSADTYFYEDRKWQYVGDVPYNFVKNGILAGRSARLCLLHGAGQLAGHDGEERRRRLLLSVDLQGRRRRLPRRREELQAAHSANVPAKDFWSVLVYDSLSRSELKNGQKFPSVSLYSGPKINADGSVDIYFGPEMPAGQEKNWIQTVPGKGWFPIFRFYGPLEPLYDKTWKLPDIEALA